MLSSEHPTPSHVPWPPPPWQRPQGSDVGPAGRSRCSGNKNGNSQAVLSLGLECEWIRGVGRVVLGGCEGTAVRW